jgi:hypothetical protein
MEIVYGLPPNYEEVAKTFNIRSNQGVIFTYGNKIYVPGGERISIDKPLMKHEETHARQQKVMGVEEWWDAFLADPAFRLSQELEAYRNQYRAMAGLPLEDKINYLDHISADLAGEIYGNMLTKEEAKAVIVEGIILKRPKMPGNSSDARKLKKRKRLNKKLGRR